MISRMDGTALYGLTEEERRLVEEDKNDAG